MNRPRSRLIASIAGAAGVGVLILAASSFISYEPSLGARPGYMPRGLYFLWAQSLYDPILALPGTDPDQLKGAVEALRASEDTYLQSYAPAAQERITALIHPIAFLASLPALEESRREFTARPSYIRAVRYQLALTRSLALLRAYSRSLSDEIYDLPIEYATATPGGATSKEYVARTLADAYLRAGDQSKEIRRRTACTVWYRAACELRYPSVAAPPPAASDDGAAAGAYAAALREFLFGPIPFSPRSLTETDPRQLPLVRIADAACTRAPQATYLFMWSVSRTSGRDAFWASPATEMLFHETASEGDAFGRDLASAGVEYAYQMMNPYLCFDYGIDVGKIRTAYFLEQALADPILRAYAEADLPEAFRPLQSLEGAIAASDTLIDTANIEAYIRGIEAQLYDPSAALGAITDADRRRLIELVTLWRSKTAWLATEISRMDDMAMTNRYVLRVTKLPIEALFLSRSYYSTLLLSGNETIYGSPLRFTEHRADPADPEGGLVPYQGGLEQTVPLEVLPSFLLREGERSESVYTVENNDYD